MPPNFERPLRLRRIRRTSTQILRLWLKIAEAMHRTLHLTIRRIREELERRRER